MNLVICTWSLRDSSGTGSSSPVQTGLYFVCVRYVPVWLICVCFIVSAMFNISLAVYVYLLLLPFGRDGYATGSRLWHRAASVGQEAICLPIMFLYVLLCTYYLYFVYPCVRSYLHHVLLCSYYLSTDSRYPLRGSCEQAPFPQM